MTTQSATSQLDPQIMTAIQSQEQTSVIACTTGSMKKNSNNPDDVLIRLAICPQLYANVNSESHEQLHSVLNKDNYFLNMMQPATHVFMKRLLVNLRNEKLNNQEIKRQQQILQKHGLVGHISTDSLGRITIIGDTGMYDRIFTR